MTERATGRHRASHKSASSSLATLTGPLSVVGDCVGAVRRSGVIIAMSSGLVATMALPAHAVATGPEANGPQTASIPAVPVGESSAFFASPEGGLLALPAGLALEDGTVSAPAAATLDFDQTTFIAVPTPDGVAPQAPAVARTGTANGDDAVKPATAVVKPVTKKAPTTRREARQQQAAAASTSTAKSSSSSSAASSGSASTATAATAVSASGLGARAVTIASRYLGIAYRYGGSKPSTGFDCSGLVQYVYAQLGKKLPRTADAQARAVKHIPRSQAKPGDLVLFPGGGHIGIYMGNNTMLDAPHTGTVVQIRKIYSASVSFGRVV